MYVQGACITWCLVKIKQSRSKVHRMQNKASELMEISPDECKFSKKISLLKLICHCVHFFLLFPHNEHRCCKFVVMLEQLRMNSCVTYNRSYFFASNGCQ